MCEKVDPAGEFGFSWLILLQVRKVASKEKEPSGDRNPSYDTHFVKCAEVQLRVASEFVSGL